MWKLRSTLSLFWLLLLRLVAARSEGGSSNWQTLGGYAPLVIARGGFSGIFPDSSFNAYKLAVQTSLPNLHVWCGVQLTKEGVGICIPDIRLENASNIDMVYPDRDNQYTVNGVSMHGWFSVDFTIDDLASVDLKQRIFSRAPNFDNILDQILTVDGLLSLKPPKLWLNIQYDEFFSQHNQSMRSFIVSISKRAVVNYVSSSEVGFLRSIVSHFKTGPTKLVLQFLGRDDVEPSTNQTYGSLLKNLTLIKTFATGILVPKNYIWPVDNDQYLQNHTSLVMDAHKFGLEVFAFNFINDDASIPYNYSYDPVAEYLSFIDNGEFSVDGVVSDFPITPSATIDCYSHMSKNETMQAKLLIISSEGASGDYPGCTDRAYRKAISDGADILDCPVQMTNDGIPFCLGYVNLRDKTNAAQSEFSNLATNNPDLNITDGIFAYNLTWNQIQRLKPAISNPYANYSLFRNPRSRNEGNLMKLSDFLDFANNASSVSGVLIGIENAAYLADSQGLGVTEAVLSALSKAGYDNQTSKTIMIKSSDSALLSKFKSSGNNYELVYLVDEDVRGILNSTILEIKKFATSVVVSKNSIFPTDKLFVTGETDIVGKLQAFNLPVYVQSFRNEFVSQPWDFFSDPYMEMYMHVIYKGVNGVITEYPATVSRFIRNRCLGYENGPMYMSAVEPGALIKLMVPSDLPPSMAPNPILTENDVVEPPLPPVTERPPSNDSGIRASGPTPPNGQPTLVASIVLSVAAVLAAVVICRG